MKATMIIGVLRGKLCWNYETGETCNWFDERLFCLLKFQNHKIDGKGCWKSPDCIKLEEVE